MWKRPWRYWLRKVRKRQNPKRITGNIKRTFRRRF